MELAVRSGHPDLLLELEWSSTRTIKDLLGYRAWLAVALSRCIASRFRH
jgi:hypothetical protein